MNRTFALVDCNNFYVSCERLFRPDLKDSPVVVLSNNDGCIVARSQEVKALGIKMGTPLFKVKQEISRHNVHVFSSNYTLYGDISSRVMQTLEQFSPHVEVYSIDEAFLDLSGIRAISPHGNLIRSTVMQHIGVPVCVGMAPTKTLAKLANYAAKKFPATGGVVDLSEPSRQRRLMQITPVGEVWGVGRRLTRRLQNVGVKTAWALAQMTPSRVRRRYSVVLERTVRELNGDSCLEMEGHAPPRQQIVCSRSFGEKLTRYSDVKEAVCEFAARAAEKLRQDNQLALMVIVFIRTSPFDDSRPNYSNSATGRLAEPSSDSRTILEMTARLLKMIWKDGYHYAKAGVMLGDFCAPDNVQPNLYTKPGASRLDDTLMLALDSINRGGQGKVWFGGQRAKKDWFMKQTNVSPAYTTRWDSIPEVS